jgi:hypothetical protein
MSQSITAERERKKERERESYGSISLRSLIQYLVSTYFLLFFSIVSLPPISFRILAMCPTTPHLLPYHLPNSVLSASQPLTSFLIAFPSILLFLSLPASRTHHDSVYTPLPDLSYGNIPYKKISWIAIQSTIKYGLPNYLEVSSSAFFPR